MRLPAKLPGAVLLSVMLVGVASLVAYAASILFADAFGTLDTSHWTVVDSQQKVTATGRLAINNHVPPVWNDPSLVSKDVYARVAGRALVSNVIHASVSDTGPVIGWTTFPLPADPRQAVHGLLAQSRILNVVRGSAGPRALGTWNNVDFSQALSNTEYIYSIVLRPRGAFYFVSSGAGGTHATWPQASLVWVDSSQTASSLSPFVSQFSGGALVDDLRVVDLDAPFTTPYGIATATDTFTRADGPLAGSSVENGAATWTADSGSWAISNGRAAPTSGPGIASVPATADGIFDVTLHTLPSGFVHAGLVFRMTDAQNFLKLAVWSDRIRFSRFVNGAETVIGEAGFSAQPNTDYRLRVRANGTAIRLYMNEAEPMEAQFNVSFNSRATRAGLDRRDGGSSYDDFAAWPANVALPAEAGPGPYAAARGTTTLEQEPWENNAVPPSPPWQSFIKRWVITADNTLRLQDLNNMLLKDIGRSDAEISTDVLLPDHDGIILAGLALRAHDTFNMYFARIFKIPNDPTIEIELGRFVNGTGAIIKYIPITGQVALGQTVRLRAVTKGPWITVYLNDVPKLTAYGTELTTDTGFGLYTDSSDSGSALDNWEVKALP